MSIVDKTKLVEYLKYYYFKNKGNTITPIKLQKTLYFLFAFWAKYVSLAKNGSKTENDFQEHSDELFKANFKAWAYGPVDEKVYRDFKKNSEFDQSKVDLFIKKTDLEVREFIDSFSMKLFNTSDFGLVDLSHRDECWKKHYKNGETSTITSEEIRLEYGQKS